MYMSRKSALCYNVGKKELCMEINQIYTIIAVNGGLFLTGMAAMISLFIWNRSEARSDMRLMLSMIDGIQKEMKDFHGRLCAIEERNKGK